MAMRSILELPGYSLFHMETDPRHNDTKTCQFPYRGGFPLTVWLKCEEALWYNYSTRINSDPTH